MPRPSPEIAGACPKTFSGSILLWRQMRAQVSSDKALKTASGSVSSECCGLAVSPSLTAWDTALHYLPPQLATARNTAITQHYVPPLAHYCLLLATTTTTSTTRHYSPVLAITRHYSPLLRLLSITLELRLNPCSPLAAPTRHHFQLHATTPITNHR